MNNPMVSVIIPVYNAEKYICQCMDSLLAQTYQSFEIICVDDGSTDNTYAILQKYAEDDRVTLLRQKNEYAGVARNNGLKKANGKYLLFLDADDFFCEDMLEEAVRKAEVDNAEIVVFDAYRFNELTKSVEPERWCFLKAELWGEEVRAAENNAEVIYEFTTPVPWNKLFLREFVIQHELEFQAIKRSNDILFVYAAISCAKRISVLNRKLLYYRDCNSESLQGSGDDTPCIFAEALYALREYLADRNLLQRFRTSFDNMVISIGFYNLTNMKSEAAYRMLYTQLYDEIFPKLGIVKKPMDVMLEEAIKKKQSCIVYGAGGVSRAFIWMLLSRFSYPADKIKVVVTELGNNACEVCGIKVIPFSTHITDNFSDLVVVAVTNERIQSIIEDTVKQRGFQNIIKIGFNDLAHIY